MEPSNQILKTGYTQATIVILENDKPGGFFEFSYQSRGPFYQAEGGAFLEIVIVRGGGSLVTRSVRYYAEGDAGGEFFGIPNVAVFPPGVTSQTIFIAAQADRIPELHEDFVLTLQSYGNPPSELGSRTRVNITIVQNDDPYGVFTFDENPMIRNIDESSEEGYHTALFPVRRSAGLFDTVGVTWEVTPYSSVVDLSPANGTLIFEDGISYRYIEIVATDDLVSDLF